MEQTAVEWFVGEMFKQGYLNDKPLTVVNIEHFVKQSKEIEKENMIDFAFNFYYDFCNKTGVPFNLISENRTNVEDYYNRTFKSE